MKNISQAVGLRSPPCARIISTDGSLRRLHVETTCIIGGLLPMKIMWNRTACKNVIRIRGCLEQRCFKGRLQLHPGDSGAVRRCLRPLHKPRQMHNDPNPLLLGRHPGRAPSLPLQDPRVPDQVPGCATLVVQAQPRRGATTRR